MKAKDNYSRLAPEDALESSRYFDKVLDRFGIDMDSSESQIKLTWHMIAGDGAGNISECEKASKGVLYLICRHPAHAASIRMSSKELIKKVNSVYPDLGITKIRVRIC